MHGRSHCCLLELLIVLITPTAGAQVGAAQPARVSHEIVRSGAEFSLPSVDARSHRAPFMPALRERPALPDLVRAAGMIFSATVKAIERRPATAGQSIATVAITLHVERAVRGVTPGDDVTVSQWIGLWSGGQRYRVGERVLLFLYPRSKLGLTSCVGGTLGRFNMDAWGRVLLSAQHLTAFQKDPVLGGKSRVVFGDFARAVRHAGEEE